LEKDIKYLVTKIVLDINNILGANFFRQQDPSDGRKKLNDKKIEEVSKIFDYPFFSKYETTRYNAYDLLEKLNINVCLL
jgi:hypothetical protein